MRTCYNCGWEWRKPHEPAFREMCPRCDAFLHACKNCAHYDETAHHQCKSSTTEYVGDKERSNFCEEFRYQIQQVEKPVENTDQFPRNGRKEQSNKAVDAREKWRQLFKDD